MFSGDLVWLPSDIRLIQFDKEKDSVVKRFKNNESPAHVILLENEERAIYCKIYHDGETWMVLRKDIYPTSEEDPC